MWRRVLPRNVPRADTLIALSIPVGCFALLLEAYFRSNVSEADEAAACAYEPTTKLIRHCHVKELERNGIVVIPNAISNMSINNARGDIDNFTKRSIGKFETTPNDDDVRQDVIVWIGESTLASTNCSSSSSSSQNEQEEFQDLMHCVRLIRGVAYALQIQGYDRDNGIINNNNNNTASNVVKSSSSKVHMVPQLCQLALYPGNETAGYARHLDQCNNSIFELGLLEWLRLSDYRSRAITTILYLNNHDRSTNAGGALRCWVAANTTRADDDVKRKEDYNENEQFQDPFDIVPKGGTLVIFQSDRVEHEVLQSSEDRYALTNWIMSV